MNRPFKALCLAGAGLSLMMCNIEDDPEEALFSEEVAQAAPAPAPCFPVSTQQHSGVNDSFAAGPAEVPAPRANVLAYINTHYSIPGVRNYDDAHANQYFAHSFLFTPPSAQHVLIGATLLGRLQCLGSNDAFYTGFVDPISGLPPAPYWGGYLTAPPFSAACGTLAAPVDFSINLASTPTTAQNLVPTMTANGFLDVLMQDDSQMDFLTLRLSWGCKGKTQPSAVADL